MDNPDIAVQADEEAIPHIMEAAYVLRSWAWPVKADGTLIEGKENELLLAASMAATQLIAFYGQR